MSPKPFFLQLTGLTLLAAGIVVLLNTLPQLEEHYPLGWISLGIFFFLTVLMYFAGRQAAGSANKNDFTSVVLAFTLGKLFVIILAVFGYSQLREPETNFFILPFFSMYLIYTIFETYVMMKLGKAKT
jgi:hypothetical protein